VAETGFKIRNRERDETDIGNVVAARARAGDRRPRERATLTIRGLERWEAHRSLSARPISAFLAFFPVG
jgi:hypothetical protein